MDLRVESLSFTYPSGVTALQDVSMQAKSGESVAIIGQNGAGKTTLVKHLNGLLRPSQGQVWVGDWDTRQRAVAELAHRVGFVFQNPDDQLFQSTVGAEVSFGPKNLGWTAERVEAHCRDALEIVGLAGAVDRHPYDLSPGERKQVALAAVLAMDTPILVLDEPTTGQDFAGVALVGQIVERLKEQGKTVLTITHDIDFCAEHFSRVVVMAAGQVLLDGPARQALAATQVLAQSLVEPPQVMRLALALALEARPLNVEEFVHALTQASVAE